ncbi:MAG: hypothetical protein RBT66_07035 [bacterium]|jgi:predicted HAD superfamily phosphohydrolase|nr:hypothetical protein [Methanocellales archaeon]MDX9780775.1 hypothetical protein [bacterium]
MSGQSGYGATISGAVLGSFVGVQSVTVGGLEVDFDEIAVINGHRDGTATFTNASDQVTGTDTNWTASFVGRMIRLDADDVWYTIESVESATALTLTEAYDETGGADGTYFIAADRVVEHLPTKAREQTIEVSLAWSAAQYDIWRDAAEAQTVDAFTLTDAGDSTHIGDCLVRSVSGPNLDADSHQQYTVTLQPQTDVDFTPSA